MNIAECQIFFTALTTVNIAGSQVILSNLDAETNTGKKNYRQYSAIT